MIGKIIYPVFTFHVRCNKSNQLKICLYLERKVIWGILIMLKHVSHVLFTPSAFHPCQNLTVIRAGIAFLSLWYDINLDKGLCFFYPISIFEISSDVSEVKSTSSCEFKSGTFPTQYAMVMFATYAHVSLKVHSNYESANGIQSLSMIN